jgi:hypothetical protein
MRAQREYFLELIYVHRFKLSFMFIGQPHENSQEGVIGEWITRIRQRLRSRKD